MSESTAHYLSYTFDAGPVHELGDNTFFGPIFPREGELEALVA